MTDLEKLVKDFTDALKTSEEYQELKATLKDREYVCFWMPTHTFHKCSSWGISPNSEVNIQDYDH